MPKIDVNGLQVHYTQSGKGPDVVLIHGMAGNLSLWHLKMVPTLRKHFRVTTYDLRGHGHTSIPPTGYTTRHMADDLIGLMDALEIQSAFLVGHSLGADIALHTALVYPDRVKQLILIEAALPALINTRKQEDWAGWEYWARTIEKYTGQAVPPERRTDLAYLIEMTADVPILFGPSRGQARNKGPVMALLNETTLMEDYTIVGELTLENLPNIPHPKLLIYDDASPYMNSFEVLEKQLVNCEIVLFPPNEHSHFGPLVQPDLLSSYILRFFPTDAAEESAWQTTF